MPKIDWKLLGQQAAFPLALMVVFATMITMMYGKADKEGIQSYILVGIAAIAFAVMLWLVARIILSKEGMTKLSTEERLTLAQMIASLEKMKGPDVSRHLGVGKTKVLTLLKRLAQ
jgi:hypothetical protein